jgi:hypothetical protein
MKFIWINMIVVVDNENTESKSMSCFQPLLGRSTHALRVIRRRNYGNGGTTCSCPHHPLAHDDTWQSHLVGSALARSHASPLTDWPNERLTSAWDWKYSENLTNWRSEWWNLDCTVYSIGVDRIWPEFSVRIMLIQFTLHLWKVYGALAPQYHARATSCL